MRLWLCVQWVKSKESKAHRDVDTVSAIGQGKTQQNSKSVQIMTGHAFGLAYLKSGLARNRWVFSDLSTDYSITQAKEC